MAAPKQPGPSHPAASTGADLDNSLGNLLPQPVYQVLRNHFLRPHDTIHVTRYFFHEWFTRLGLQRWLLVLLLREALATSDQRGVVRITRTELATNLECSEKTVSDLLRHIPHPTRRGWRAIDPNGPDGEPDSRRKALSHFIPRLRYWYEKDPNSDAPPKRRGFIIAVSMDDPLTPEDERRMRSLSLEQISNIVAGDVAPEARDAPQERVHPEGNFNLSGLLPEGTHDLLEMAPERSYGLSGPPLKGTDDLSGTLKGSNDPISLTLTKLTKYIQENIDRTLTLTPDIRRGVTPLVQWAEEALADFHSTGMFYKVLCTLYPDHLDLFVQAIGEALEIGRIDQHANLGAIFVESIKTLAREAGIDLGFAGTSAGLSGTEISGDDHLEGDLADNWGLPDSVDGWTADGLWQEALAALQLQMPRSTFEMWLHNTRGVRWDGDRLVIELRNTQAREWLENRMHPKIVQSVRDLVGHEVQVAYECRSVV